jgi:hypothetical protein
LPRLSLRRPTPAMAVACTALVAALGGVAVASPLGGDGRIHLCFSQIAIDNPAPSEGDYVVATNAGTACPGDYPDELVFNQTGPRGAQGPQGSGGATGPAGAVIRQAALDAALADRLVEKFDKAEDRTKLSDRELDRIRAKLNAIERAKAAARNDALVRQIQAVREQVSGVAAQVNSVSAANKRLVEEMRKG